MECLSRAQENVIVGQPRKNRITAGKGLGAQRRGKKEIEFGYDSLKDEYTIRKIIYFWKY